jgi:GntR family transcriptional regulator, carbon starvation induced regulator
MMSEVRQLPQAGRGRLSDVIDRLRDEILTGAIRPGARLRLEALRERYLVSAGTLREALSRLVAEGLVLIDGQRGFRAMPVRAEEVDDIMETRMVLESHALRRAIARADVEWEGRIVAIHHRLMRIEEEAARTAWKDASLAVAWHDANREFHLTLCSGAGSDWVQRFLATLADQTRRYGRRVLHEPIAATAFADEHRRLMQAILARDADMACAVLAEHLATVHKGLLAELSAARGDESAI